MDILGVLPLEGVVVDEHEHEWLSVCCGAKEAESVEGMCGRCRDWTGFDCECGKWRPTG